MSDVTETVNKVQPSDNILSQAEEAFSKSVSDVIRIFDKYAEDKKMEEEEKEAEYERKSARDRQIIEENLKQETVNTRKTNKFPTSEFAKQMAEKARKDRIVYLQYQQDLKEEKQAAEVAKLQAEETARIAADEKEAAKLQAEETARIADEKEAARLQAEEAAKLQAEETKIITDYIEKSIENKNSIQVQQKNLIPFFYYLTSDSKNFVPSTTENKEIQDILKEYVKTINREEFDQICSNELNNFFYNGITKYFGSIHKALSYLKYIILQDTNIELIKKHDTNNITYELCKRFVYLYIFLYGGQQSFTLDKFKYEELIKTSKTPEMQYIYTKIQTILENSYDDVNTSIAPLLKGMIILMNKLKPPIFTKGGKKTKSLKKNKKNKSRRN